MCATVKQRNNNIENDWWSEIGRHYAQAKEVFCYCFKAHYYNWIRQLIVQDHTCLHSLTAILNTQALRLNNEARKTSTAGEMVNLMTTDVQRLMELMNYLNTLWSGPFQIAVAIFFLYNTMGVSILAGVGVMILLIPLNFVVSRIVKKLQVSCYFNE